MHNFRLSKSTSAATSTSTTTSVSTSESSQPDLAIEQHQQGSFVGLLTTVHAPESRYIPAADQYTGLKVLAEICTSRVHVDPFEALATYQTVSLDDDAHEQSASSLTLSDEPLLANEPPQAADDANPIMEKAEESKPRSGQNVTDQNDDSTDRWIMYSGDETRPFKCDYEGCNKAYLSDRALRRHYIIHTKDEIRPFQCGYEGCGKTYLSTRALRRHAVVHTDTQLRCYSGDCTGNIRYPSRRSLDQHIRGQHRPKMYECGFCRKQYKLLEYLKRHLQTVHSTEKEQTTKKGQKPPPKRKRK